MTCLFIDGFDTKDTSLKWTGGVSLSGYSSSTRFSTGFAATFGNESTFMKQFVTAASPIYVGFAYRQDSNNTNTTYPFLQLLGDNGATQHMNLRLNGTSLVLYRGGTVIATVPGILLATAWNYIEISQTVDSTSSGTCTVKVNNATVISFTGVTKNGGTNNTIDTVQFGGLFAGGAGTTYVDDVYINNSSGSFNTGFLGDVRVQTLSPTAAGTNTQLTPTSGSNYANVNEVPDNQATYNSSSTVGQHDTYTMADLVAGTGTVYAVQQTMTASKDNSGTANFKNALYLGGSFYYGSSKSLGTSWAQFRDMYETDPSTTVAWTPTGVNGAEAGVEVA